MEHSADLPLEEFSSVFNSTYQYLSETIDEGFGVKTVMVVLTFISTVYSTFKLIPKTAKCAKTVASGTYSCLSSVIRHVVDCVMLLFGHKVQMTDEERFEKFVEQFSNEQKRLQDLLNTVILKEIEQMVVMRQICDKLEIAVNAESKSGDNDSWPSGKNPYDMSSTAQVSF
nr:NSP4 [Rotavirus A]